MWQFLFKKEGQKKKKIPKRKKKNQIKEPSQLVAVLKLDTRIDTQQGLDFMQFSNTYLNTLVVTSVVHVSVNNRIHTVCKSCVNVNDLHTSASKLLALCTTIACIVLLTLTQGHCKYLSNNTYTALHKCFNKVTQFNMLITSGKVFMASLYDDLARFGYILTRYENSPKKKKRKKP
jgi:hypothetical protein